MKTLEIDIETYSSADLSKSGVYKYAEAADFEILLFGFSVDRGSANVVDITSGEKIPDEILDALTDDDVLKWAHNATFERVCLSSWLRRNYPGIFRGYSTEDDALANYLSPVSWRCSMVWSAYLGLPNSLAQIGAILGLDQQKMTEGKELIRYFCMPCKPTKANGGRIRNLPCHASDKWEALKRYNLRDVEVEISICDRLKKFPVPDTIWQEYSLDQEINDRGIMVDMGLVKNAMGFDERAREVFLKEMQELTGLENPNSVAQLRFWLDKHGYSMEGLGKKDVAEAIKTAQEPVRSVLQLRQRVSRSSVKKYQAMANMACMDNRARGCFAFYGASRTGRWAGRGIQLQNLARNYISDLSEARTLVRQGQYDVMEMLYDDVPDTLSQLIRTAFVPRQGMKFVVADFSAIEARVISWLSGEKWKSEAFDRGEDIYCSTASQMFGVPVVKHGENGELRQKGKIAELACGYGGSVGALKAMGALDMGLQEDELQSIVDMWRNANPYIVKLWWAVDRCVKETVMERRDTSTHGLEFSYRSGLLFIKLPSGRKLSYVKPMIGENRFGGEAVTYEGLGAARKWERIESYGPKFVENIVQAISRDILCYAMRNLSYCMIVGHVHDEVIIECSREVSLDAICRLMSRTPPWADGLLLRADGYECEFYQKD